MFIATQHENITLIVAADEPEDFDGLAEQHEQVDFLDMLGDPFYKGFHRAPIPFNGESAVLSEIEFRTVSRVEAIDAQEAMVERRNLKIAAEGPPDRRTLAEVYGLDKDDPWNNGTQEQKEAARKQDEKMRQLREEGGVTGESFTGSSGDKLRIGKVEVVLDEHGNLKSAKVRATKHAISKHLLTVDGETMIWEPLWDEMKMPEGRVLEIDGNSATIMIHEYETKDYQAYFDRAGRTFTLTKLVDEKFRVPDDVEGDMFFAVHVRGTTCAELLPAIVPLMRPVASGDYQGDAWVVYPRASMAEVVQQAIVASGTECAVVATNRVGQPIVSDAREEVKVQDQFEHIDIGPRPWNDRASEIATMSEEERSEWAKSVKAGEYMYAIGTNSRGRTIVYITPQDYFDNTGDLWKGELILDSLPEFSKIAKPTDEANVFEIIGERSVAENLAFWGMTESWLLRGHINDLLAEEKARLSI